MKLSLVEYDAYDDNFIEDAKDIDLFDHGHGCDNGHDVNYEGLIEMMEMMKE